MQRLTNLDTVQEFWNASVLEEVASKVSPASLQIFVDRLKLLLHTSGRLRLSDSASRGLQLLLEAVRSLDKRRVLLCDFNCPKVADAVLAAGCEVDLYDFDGYDGAIDWERVSTLVRHDHAAVVVAHFFGVPTDFRPLIDRARTLGVALIEDCAHCLGGTIDGVAAGTLGDAAIFSFNYDKPLSLGGGGAVLINNGEFAARFPTDAQPPSPEVEHTELRRFLRYLWRRRRNISREHGPVRQAIRKLPGIRRLISPPQFIPASGLGSLRAALGIWQLDHYSDVLAVRNSNAQRIAERLGSATWHVGAGIRPAWLKQKCFMVPWTDIAKLSADLQSMSYRVGRFNWPRTLSDYLGRARSCPVAEEIAARSVDCPIHQEVSSGEIEFLASELSC